MQDLLELVKAYRVFLLELGEHFQRVKDLELFRGYADNFMDLVKSPEIGFSVDEANTLIRMYNMFCMLEPEDLPGHHHMKMMIKKDVSMDLLESAKTLSVKDFKELIKDEETGTQDRTYTYEVVKRCNETNSITKVYDEVELKEALTQIK